MFTNIALALIVLLAAVLRFYDIGRIGDANTYYTAAVESMLQSWHNFFFVAAEPGGSVTVDKPPVGLWLQSLSASIFGVNGFAVVLPSILAGLASVVLLFHMVQPRFGRAAGLLAALILAITPVVVAMERNNTPDGMLIFTLLLAAWAFLRATESQSHHLRYLLLGSVLVGVGFNIKMMQALLPLPAFYALYFVGAQLGWRRKLGHLTLATMVLIPIALLWAILVDLTPAEQRPYIGSSSTNSVIELMLGYNGVQRLLGMQMGGGVVGAIRPPMPPGDGNGVPTLPDNAGRAMPIGGPAAAFGTGEAGPLRLFQAGLAAEASWLMPFALVLLLVMVGSYARTEVRSQKLEVGNISYSALRNGLVLWGGYLLTCGAFFSVAGFFHEYYLAMMGIPLAAVVAMGASFLWQLAKSRPWLATVLLLASVALTLAYQVYAVSLYTSNRLWLMLPIALALVGFVLLISALRQQQHRLRQIAFSSVLLALLIVPLVWSALTTAYMNNTVLPQAYGETMAFGNRSGMPDRPRDDGAMPRGTDGVNENLLDYLQANTLDVQYLVVVPSSQVGAAYVLATGRPVLYAGGFSGGDPVIDGAGLAQLVAQGEVRYVLWGSGAGPGANSANGIAEYLRSACTVVEDDGLGLDQDVMGGLGRGPAGVNTLYRCGS
jgi:4-amino-4-deoxy-L-arabinose transferase-like glycosyltransferase